MTTKRPMTQEEKDTFALGIVRGISFLGDKLDMPDTIQSMVCQAALAASAEMLGGVEDSVLHHARDLLAISLTVGQEEKQKRRDYYEKHSH